MENTVEGAGESMERLWPMKKDAGLVRALHEQNKEDTKIEYWALRVQSCQRAMERGKQ